MDATVDDFLNEINEIVPPKNNKPQCVWQECYDKLTGFSYYWNTKTDEVTWTKPTEFKTIKEAAKDKSGNPKLNKANPPRGGPLFPSTSTVSVAENVKIYKLSESTSSHHFPKRQQRVPSPISTSRKKSSDSEDEKIVLISSYGGDTDSEEDDSSDNKNTSISAERNLNENNPRAQDVINTLTETQDSTKKSISHPKSAINENNVTLNQPPTRKTLTGFSLVAGYSDSEDEQDNEELKALFPTVNETKVSHSTLFPIAQPIDVNDFKETVPVEKPEDDDQTSTFDSKAFQRKKRIGIALVNTAKKNKLDDRMENKDKKAFDKSNLYSSFTKGEVMFVKSDVLNPSQSETLDSNHSSPVPELRMVKHEEVDDTYATLKEKLSFLSEGRSKILPVQIMMIQAETLYTAVKEGGLKVSYIQKWLNETCSELIKLEKEAAPEGWLLEWDRSHKRYYYQNQVTGESQWKYPQQDVVRCDEAMDICTTPPVDCSEVTIQLVPPLPPIIRNPTPPPPPIISAESHKVAVLDVPLPPSTVTPNVIYEDNGEPLPPGVDPPEIANPKVKEKNMNNALDSFYSDIAAIENTNSPPVSQIEDNKNEVLLEPASELLRKKKKTKVKLTQGLSMKKKGVSKLVEKWKNVQMSLDE